jgi:hypothetical protein
MQENHVAAQTSSSRHPHDWGRALSVVLTRLAEDLSGEGLGQPDEVLLDRQIRLTIVAEGEDGARITASCPDDVTGAPESAPLRHR